MDNFLSTSHALVDRYIAVKFKGADRAALRADCLAWLEQLPAEHKRVRALYPGGGRALCSQLDLLDRAKDRVRSVADNCR